MGKKKIKYKLKVNFFFAREDKVLYKASGLSPYYHNKKCQVKLFKGDCLKILSRVPDNCVDMIFADPPYFLSNGGITCHSGRMVSVNKGRWDISRGVEENHKFNLAWLEACQRVLKPNGTIWVSGTAHVIYSVGYAMQQLGYKILNDIVWYKKNAPPNLSCRYFTHSTEIILWAAKNNKSKHYFDYKLMRKMANGKQMRSFWEINGDLELQNVWRFSSPSKREKLFGKHPTQKPLELLRRIILASTPKGALVLDPFNGSGTTGVVAVQLGRKYVGVDLEEEYLQLTLKRLGMVTKKT